MKKWIFIIWSNLAVFYGPVALADYYLKVTATGQRIDDTVVIASSTAADLAISVVGDFPTDGPVHFENSYLGSWVKTLRKESAHVDNLNFYVAGVPRSITLLNVTDGGRQVITAGNPPITLTGAPAILMKDGLLISPGLSRYSGSKKEVYVAASMPSRMVVAKKYVDPISFSGVQSEVIADSSKYCVEGWSSSSEFPDHVEVWAADPDNPCRSFQIYGGKIKYTILEE